MKIRDETKSRVQEKLEKLKTRAGYKKLLSDLMYPSKKRTENKQAITQYAKVMTSKIDGLEPLIKSMKSHIDYIGDPDKFVAAYLLIGKSFTSLKATLHLTQAGYSFQSVELVRSSMESLYLAATLLEDGQEENVKKWFEGEIIGNSVSRNTLHEAVNAHVEKAEGETIPFKEALSDVYSVYSGYTHSSYAALFDFIDVFMEDFDFQHNAQFHYSRRNLDLIDHLYVNILLGLKNFYIRVKDEANLQKVEVLIQQEGGALASREEIDKEMSRYKK